MPEPSPLVTTLSSGRHAICRCGRTGNAPFCDGTHKGSEHTPQILDLEQEKPLAWCRCRQSATLPLCDGTHKTLQSPSA